MYVDDQQVTNAQITAVTGTTNDGKVTATKYANAIWIRRYTGTASQTVDFILNGRYSSTFTSDFRGRGIAYAAMSFDWGDGKLFRGPPLMTFVIKGKKCYDPRLDASPGAAPTNPAFAAWTENPALCWADYAMGDYGGAVASTSINWASVVAAANICDALVSIPGATTQKRYTFNSRVILPVDPDWRENAKLFVDAMMGRMVFRDGIWFIYAGAFDSASYTIEKTDWLSIDRIKTVAPRDGGRWNTVRCWYVDPSRNWQRVECYPRRNATYKSADGAEEIALEMEQPACISEYEAQRKAEFMLRQSRNQIAISGKLGPKFRKAATGEMVAVNFEELGWVSKLMRIRTMSLNPDGTSDVGLVEEQSADWTDLGSGEYNAPSTSTIPATNPTTPTEATLSVINVVNGTIRFKMATPTVKPTGTQYRIIRSSVSTDASVGTAIYDGVSQVVDYPAPPSNFYYFSQAYANSYTGPYSPNTLGLAAFAYTSNVTQVNCTVAQTFSKGGTALFASEMGRVDFAPTSAGAVVSITATFRSGLGNVFGTNGVYVGFVTGVTSSYATPTIQNGGVITTDRRPTQITGVFTYSANNSAYAGLYWDTTSGPNSFDFDNVAIRTEFIRL